jgi:WD40 repeat protein
VLKEPVSQTRDDITVTVYEAVLTAEKSEIHYGVSGIPLSAYPRSEASTDGCKQTEYLRLPDGREIETHKPVPPEVNEAVLVIPCFFNTLPDSVPVDWEIPFEFIPLPEDVEIIPVEESNPEDSTGTPTPTDTQNDPAATSQAENAAVRIEKTIQTEEGYILIGSIAINSGAEGYTQITGIPQIMDADKSEVEYEYPTDIQPVSEDNHSMPWAVQFKAAGVAFPITLQFTGEEYSKVTAESPAILTFDAGEDPQLGQKWDIQQNFSIADYQFRLESIQAGRDGYSFTINTSLNEDELITPPSIEIKGYQALGGGGGSGSISLAFAEIPKGQLELLFSSFYRLSDSYTWTIEWEPQEIQSDWPTPTPPPANICVNEDNYEHIEAFSTTATGFIIRTEINPEVNLVQTDLNGGNRRVFGADRNRGALSPDGSTLAYGSEEGLHLADLSTGNETILDGMGSHEISWSPDSSQIALINPLGKYGVFITSLLDQQLVQVSNLGYETIAGWSPDGNKLYYSIPGSTQDGFLLKEYDLTDGGISDKLVLEGSSLKAPSARISPDGSRIAYRSRYHNQVNLISMDGEQSRVIFSLPDDRFAVNGIAWEANTRRLGISAQDMTISGNQISMLFLLDPSTCESYSVENFAGELNGIWIDTPQ